MKKTYLPSDASNIEESATSAPDVPPRTLWLRSAGLTLGYFALAQLAFGLTAATSYEVSVWPAAGLALGALLVWGWRYWPAVWLGSFVANLLHGMVLSGNQASLSVFALSLTLATGAALQAILATRLVRPSIKTGALLATERDVLAFLLLGAPLACLLSATFGVAGLYLLHGLATDALPGTWLTWWAGDSLGVLLFAPLVLLLLWPDRQQWHGRVLQISVPILVTGVLLVGGYAVVSRVEQAAAQENFKVAAEVLYDRVVVRMSKKIGAIEGTAGLFEASDHVSRAEFAHYAARIMPQTDTQALAWLPRVTLAERAAVEGTARREDIADFVFRERGAQGRLVPAAERAEYYPALYVAKLGGKTAVLGADAGSREINRAALQRATDTTLPALSEPDGFYDQDGVRRDDWLLYLAVYRAGFDARSAGIDARREALRGFVVLAFSAQQLLADVGNSAQHNLAYRLSTVSTSGPPGLMLEHAVPQQRINRPDATYQLPGLAGERLQLEIWDRVPWQAGHSETEHFYLLGGVLLALLSVMFILTAAGQSVRVAREVARRTEELRASEAYNRSIVDSNPDCLKLISLDTRLLYMAPHACRMMEVDDFCQIENADWLAFWQGDARMAAEVAVDAARNGAMGRFQGFCPTLKGNPRWWEVTISPILGADGQPARLLAVSRDITAQRALDLAVRESEARLRSIVDNTAAFVGEMTTDGVLVEANRMALTIGGLQRKNVVGKRLEDTWWFAHSPEVQAQIRDDIAKALRGEVVRHDVDVRAADGTTFPMDFMLVPVANAEGRIVKLIPSGVDISERKRAEADVLRLNLNLEAQVLARTESLRRTEREFRSTFEGAGLGIAHISPEGRFLRVNPQLCAYSGYAEDELLGQKISLLPHPDELAAGLQAFAPVLRGEAAVMTIESRMQCKDSSPLWIHLTASLVRDEAGEIEYIVCFIKNISERKRLDAEFMAQQTVLRHILENLEEGVVCCDPAGNLTFFNKATQQWHGTDIRNVPMEDWARFYALFQGDGKTLFKTEELPIIRALSGEVVRNVEMVIVAQGQPPRFLVGSADPMFDDDGRKLGAVLVMHDVTQRRHAETALRKANEELEQRVAARTAELRQIAEALTAREEEIRSVVEYMVDCVISIDERGLIRSANPAVERLFGYSQAELLGRNVALLMPEPDASAHDGYLASYHRTGEARIIGIGRTVTGRHKSGEPITLELAISEYKLNGQRFYTGILRDIRERTRVMHELELARNAADAASQAKSAFLAAMSHEIRTPMNGVIGMIEVLERSSLMGEQVEMVELIRDSAFSLLTIIDDILDFSKIEAKGLEIECVPCSVAEVVDKVCTMLNRLAAKRDVDLTLFTDPAIPEMLLGDGLRLRQVLTNLVNNAIKFSGGLGRRGHVSVRALLVARTTQTVTLEIAVSDNGIGMDDETIGRLFNAFTQADASTTRRFGGTGLGLVIARNLVQLMGGNIAVNSVPGAGSVFSVRLSLGCLPEQSGSGATNPPVGQLAALRCLVIDDGQGIAGDLATYLTAAGAVVERAVGLADAREYASRVAGEETGHVVWVVDSGDAPPELDELRAIAHDAGQGAPHFVAVGRGRRRKPRLFAADLVQVDANALTRAIFVRAVGMAAGRWSGDVEATISPDAAVRVALPSRDEALRQGRLILVAEDNATNQKVIQRQLALLGHVADMAGDGAAALRRVASGDYGLLLTDLHMPVMDGYQLTLAVRADETGQRRLPIIALTANAIKGEAEHCRAVGMDGYLSKPTTLDELKEMLDTWLPPLDAAPQAPVLLPTRTDAPGGAASPMDVGVLERMVGNDPAVISEFLNDFRGTAATIAAELQAAIAGSQVAQAGALAHKLKSTARSFGALTLGELCDAMEQAAKTGEVAALNRLLPRFMSEATAVDAYLASRAT